MTIRNWSIISNDDNPYLAPELRSISLRGDVYNSGKFKDGCSITTSPVVSANGRTVETEGGSKYRLGAIDKSYRKFLKKIRPNWDWRNPVKVMN